MRSISEISGCNDLRDLLHQVKWASSGKRYAPIYAWPLRILARNGSSYEVIAHVRYMRIYVCEIVQGILFKRYIVTEVLEPHDIPDLDRGNVLSCNVCGGIHPYYASILRKVNGSIKVLNAGDGKAFTYHVAFRFNFSWGRLSMNLPITYWRDSCCYVKPCIELKVLSWHSDTLYYWWDVNDPDKWLIHVSWR